MPEPGRDTLDIRTPEGVVFSIGLAGPVSRFLAWFIDVLCVTAVIQVFTTVLAGFAVISFDLAGAICIIAYVVVQTGYNATLEWFWRGQTVGKRLMRLRVMDAGGMKLRFSQVALRNLLRPVDSLPILYEVGGIALLTSRRRQRLGDMVSGTVVVRLPAAILPDTHRLFPDRYNSLRAYPHLEARLRRRLTHREASIAVDALLRRDEMESSARVALFSEMADHFKSVQPFPEEALFGLSDEQVVREMVSSLFADRPA